MYLGSWKIDDLLTFTVVTTKVDTGVATDADSAPSYRIYEDETSTPILTGTMALLDSSNTAGFYSEQITLSAANGFEKGKSYNVYVQATVNSVVGATTRNFQIEAEVDANTVSGTPPDSAGVTTLLSRITSTLFSGITSLKEWLGLLAGKQTGNSTARTELRSSGSGSGTFDETTDSLEAIRDRGDAAWITVTAAAIRSAVGLASANLDSQLTAIDDFLDTEVADIKAKTDQLTFTTANKVDATIQAAGDFAQAAADKVWGTASRTLTAFGFSVTVGTNNDKTGYALSAAGVQAIWDALTAALTTANSIGKLLVDNINATISSRSSHTAADVWASATRTLTAFGFSVTVGTNNDKTGYGLSASAVQAIWDALTASFTTANSIGKLLVDNINATISSRLASVSYTAPPSVGAIADQVWDEALAGHLTAGSTGEALDNSGGGGGGASAADIADAVWDEAIADHLNAGSTGKKLNDISGATFPAGAIAFTYTVTDNVTSNPVEGVEVWFSTDNPATNIVWKGDTDAFGVARDVNGNLPNLDAGTYYVWRQKSGYIFIDPDTEVVS